MHPLMIFTIIVVSSIGAILGFSLGIKVALDTIGRREGIPKGAFGYTLVHVHDHNEYEDVKFIGVFSSWEKAQGAKQQLKDKPGFCESPNGFHTEPYEVDKIYWEEGFCTVPDEIME
jgi:hypothetical protein